MNLEIYGDSILKGIMLINGKYRIYKSNLIESLSENGIFASKTCKMGRTIVEAKDIIENTSELDLNDHVVLLEFGGNDSAYNWTEVSSNPTGVHFPITKEDDFVSAYSETIDYLKNKGATPIITNLFPIDSEKYLNFVSKGLSKENILSWLGDVNMLYRWHEHYNNLVEKIGREFSLDIIDIRNMFLNRHDFKDLLCEDGIHPTEIGHEMIEEQIINYFENKNEK